MCVCVRVYAFCVYTYLVIEKKSAEYTSTYLFKVFVCIHKSNIFIRIKSM